MLRLLRDTPVSLEYALTVLVRELRAFDDLRAWKDAARNFADRVEKTSDPLSLKQEWIIEAQAVAQKYDAGHMVRSIDDAAKGWRSKGQSGSIVATGFAEIDRATGGGLGRGDLMVVGGGTNAGKSFVAAKMLKNQADMGKTCLYISVEDSEELLICRMLGDYAVPPLSPKDIRIAMHGGRSPADPKDIDVAAARMAAHQQGRVKSMFAPKAKVSQVCNAMKQHRYLHGVDMVVVDYLQAVIPDESSNNKTQDVSNVVSELKRTAHEVGVALVLMSQFARDEYRDGAEPTVNSCKYAGDIENESEVMLLLWRDQDHELWGKLAKLKWASSVGHRYIIATDSTSGAILDWTKQVEEAGGDSDSKPQKQKFKRREG
jgi:replicative DNA helicase